MNNKEITFLEKIKTEERPTYPFCYENMTILNVLYN